MMKLHIKYPPQAVSDLLQNDSPIKVYSALKSTLGGWLGGGGGV
jgi:hypothetical protein